MAADPCLFVKNGVFLLLYVDDIMFIGKRDMIDAVAGDIYSSFKCKRIEPEAVAKNIERRQYLGITIEQNLRTGAITLSQSSLVDKVLSEFDMEGCSAVSSPCSEEDYSEDRHKRPSRVTRENYRSLVGMANFLAVSTRLDISFAVKELAKKNSDPSFADCHRAERLIRYLKGTRDFKLRIDSSGSAHVRAILSSRVQRIMAQACAAERDLVGFADAGWASGEDRRSTSGGLILYMGNPVFWRSFTQKSVSLSSTEAEYYAASELAREILHFRTLVDEISYHVKTESPKIAPTPVYEDNTACIDLVRNQESSKRLKHIDIRFHFIKQLHESGDICLSHVRTHEQLADILTKCLPTKLFKHLLSTINRE